MSLHQLLHEADVCRDLPGQRVFVLAEASAHRDLLPRIEFHDAPHRCLWREETLNGMESHAPWLAEVEKDSAFDLWLESVISTLPTVVIVASIPIDELWRHFRRFARFEAAGKRYFLRLGDPASLHLYTASLAREPEALVGFFAHGNIQQYLFNDPRADLDIAARTVFEPNQAMEECNGFLLWRRPKWKEA